MPGPQSSPFSIAVAAHLQRERFHRWIRRLDARHVEVVAPISEQMFRIRGILFRSEPRQYFIIINYTLTYV
jgi:hypothetical protein